MGVTVISAAGLLFIHASAGEKRECIVAFLLSFISLVHSPQPWGIGMMMSSMDINT